MDCCVLEGGVGCFVLGEVWWFFGGSVGSCDCLYLEVFSCGNGCFFL